MVEGGRRMEKLVRFRLRGLKLFRLRPTGLKARRLKASVLDTPPTIKTHCPTKRNPITQWPNFPPCMRSYHTPACCALANMFW